MPHTPTPFADHSHTKYVKLSTDSLCNNLYISWMSDDYRMIDWALITNRQHLTEYCIQFTQRFRSLSISVSVSCCRESMAVDHARVTFDYRLGRDHVSVGLVGFFLCSSPIAIDYHLICEISELPKNHTTRPPKTSRMC